MPHPWKPIISLLLCAVPLAAQVSEENSPRSHQPAEPPKAKSGQPATLAASSLKDFAGLAKDRRELIQAALAEAQPERWLRYKMGAADPAEGGFDCSGAMYFVLRKRGMRPPRTADDQYQWLRENKRLHDNPSGEVKAPDDAFFKDLLPGDLLFWGRPGSGVSHVAMFLGREKRDGRPVMINATDGRSYRGKRANGYGVYDFTVPHEGSKTVLMGYGTPPGLQGREVLAAAPADWKKQLAGDPVLAGVIEERFTVLAARGKELDVVEKAAGGKAVILLSPSPDHSFTGRFTFTLRRDD